MVASAKWPSGISATMRGFAYRISIAGGVNSELILACSIPKFHLDRGGAVHTMRTHGETYKVLLAMAYVVYDQYQMR